MATRTRKPPASAALPPETEAGVLAGVLDVLRLYGIDPRRQNTGGMTDGRGRYVRFGEPGDPDVNTQVPAGWGAASGAVLAVETKRPGFRPDGLTGEKREHFARQLARLVGINEAGGFALWIDDASRLPHVLDRIKAGWRIVFIDDYPYLDDGSPD